MRKVIFLLLACFLTVRAEQPPRVEARNYTNLLYSLVLSRNSHESHEENPFDILQGTNEQPGLLRRPILSGTYDVTLMRGSPGFLGRYGLSLHQPRTFVAGVRYGGASTSGLHELGSLCVWKNVALKINDGILLTLWQVSDRYVGVQLAQLSDNTIVSEAETPEILKK